VSRRVFGRAATVSGAAIRPQTLDKSGLRINA
jgi:hypothetical protein